MATALKDHKKEIIRLMMQIGYRHSIWQVFSDFCEISAISISNSVDWLHQAEREKRYLELINKYDKEEQKAITEALACLVMSMEKNPFEDVLGRLFHELELHNKYKGQFFTPQSVSDMMGQMALGEHDKAVLDTGYISLGEPACGSGAMILSFAKAMEQCHYNPCKQLVVTATDLDLKCVHMAYLQLSLYGIPAVVIHGNSLSMEEWSRWYTPVYMLDGWVWRKTCGNVNKRYPEDEAFKCAQEPMYAAIREIERAAHVNKVPENVIQMPEIVNEPLKIVNEGPHFDIELKERKNGQISLF